MDARELFTPIPTRSFHWHQGPPLLTWINFKSSMDK